jgi:hypothetical protein
MAGATCALDDRIKVLAISLQRQKTAMETGGLQERFWDAYWKLSEAIWSLERAAGISAPALRDEEDARSQT